MSQKRLAHLIFRTRYPREENKDLEEYILQYGTEKEAIDFLLAELQKLITQKINWPGYQLPTKLQSNAAFFEKMVLVETRKFSALKKYSKKQIRTFFLANHEIIKYAIGRWLLVNAGTAIELFNISEDNVEANFLRQLLSRGLQIGDEVIHFHVISNRERKRLKVSGFEVPFEHWHENYYLEMLSTVDQLLQSNQKSNGFFCEDSWVFDPRIHELASDGKPYASFNFLANDLLVGERYFIGEAKPDNQYFKQYEFSLRSPRRMELHKKGEFMPRTFGIYYPKDKLHEAVKMLGLID